MTKDREIVLMLLIRYRENRATAKYWQKEYGEDEHYNNILAQLYESWNILETSRRILYDIQL